MKLSDTQLTILSAASQRDDRVAILPDRLKGGAADKVVSALAGRGLVEAVTAAPGMPIWRESEDGKHLALRITDAGLAAIGIAPEPRPEAEAPTPQDPAPKKVARRAAKAGDTPQVAAPAREATGTDRKADDRLPRSGTKLDRFVAMLRRPEGASIGEAAEALDWQAHTVRGAVAGALKRKMGLTVAAEKVEGRGTVYRIAG